MYLWWPIMFKSIRLENLCCSKGWIILNSELKSFAVLTNEIFLEQPVAVVQRAENSSECQDNPSYTNGIPIDLNLTTNSKQITFSHSNPCRYQLIAFNHRPQRVWQQKSLLSRNQRMMSKLCWQNSNAVGLKGIRVNESCRLRAKSEWLTWPDKLHGKSQIVITHQLSIITRVTM